MPRIRKAEAEPYLKHVSPTRTTRGLLDRGMVAIKVQPGGTANRIGTTTMLSGLTSSGRSGVANVSSVSTGSADPTSRAIAEMIAERKLTPIFNLGFLSAVKQLLLAHAGALIPRHSNFVCRFRNFANSFHNLKFAVNLKLFRHWHSLISFAMIPDLLHT